MQLQQLLDRHNIQYFDGQGHHHCRSGWLQMDCPNCGKHSRKFHLGYNKSKHYFVCWKCGGLNRVRTLTELTGISYAEAKKFFGETTPDYSTEKKIEANRKLVLPKGIGKLELPHKRYLRKRGFDWKQIRQLWKIKGIGISTRLSWRIFIPIHLEGKMVSWTTRSISDKGLRYLSAAEKEEAVSHKTLLYGEDYVRHACVCVEGPLDVWAIGPGAVGLCGIGYSRAQVNRLANFPVRAICFDSSDSAQRRAEQLADELSVFPGETLNIQLDSEDPGEATKKEILQIRRTIGL